jgi:hypothetical protein
MSLLRTAILIVILVIGAAGLVSAARLLPRLLAHARPASPVPCFRHSARRPAGGRRSNGLRAAVSRPRNRHHPRRRTAATWPAGPMSGPPT